MDVAQFLQKLVVFGGVEIVIMRLPEGSYIPGRRWIRWLRKFRRALPGRADQRRIDSQGCVRRGGLPLGYYRYLPPGGRMLGVKALISPVPKGEGPGPPAWEKLARLPLMRKMRV